jgi:hypothetical protein
MSSPNSLQQPLVGVVVVVVVVRVVRRTAVEQGTGSTELNLELGGILSCFTVGRGRLVRSMRSVKSK